MSPTLRSALPVLVSVVVLAAYTGVWLAGYVWDDVALIVKNTVIVAPTWASVWAQDLWAGSGQPPSPYYRPLMTLSLLVDRHLLGDTPATAHLHSLAWHLAAVGLVIRLFSARVGLTRACLAGLVFGLHPIQSEAVAWIAARNDLLAATLLLASLALLDERPHRVAAAVTAMAALLSKESAVLAPVVYVAWRWAWRQPVRGGDVAALLIGIAGALALRSGAELGDFQNVLRVKPEHDFGLLWGVVQWLGWVAWPWPLVATTTVYDTPPLSAWISALVALVALGASLMRTPRAAAGLLFIFVAALAPALPTVLGTSMLGERYLYLPMLGIAGLVAVAPDHLALRLVGGGATIAALVALHVRLPDWVDNRSLFGAAARRTPDGFSLWLYGKALSHAGEKAEAVQVLDAAVMAEPFVPFACPPVASLAADLLPPEPFRARVAAWDGRGCRDAAGYDDALIWRLAQEGDVATLVPRLETQTRRDDTIRSVCVRAAVKLRDGDWTYLMGASQRHEDGPAAYIACAYAVSGSWR